MKKKCINQKYKEIKILCTLVMALLSAISKANTAKIEQPQQLISGVVKDSQGPLMGVTVMIKGTTLGTFTDEKGTFTIQASPTDFLVFSYIGYKTLEITVGSQTTLSIQLEEDTTQLKEVVLNAGYYSVKDKERTGSIERVTSAVIENQPVNNVLGTLHGRMAGVEIIQDTGLPGGAFNIRIRGLNSLRSEGNQPLFIIDGVPYSSENIGSINTSGSFPTLTSPLNSINPMDIESIEVLKDADATAIYGSRGANGVVLITTKKGKAGPTKYDINVSNGWGNVTLLPKLMNTQQYLNMREQAFENDGISVYPSSAFDVNGTWDRNRYTDWQKVLIGGTAMLSKVQMSIKGGNAQTTYMLSGHTNKETTVYPGDFTYHRGGGQFNMNHQSIDNKLNLQISTGFTVQRNDLPATNITRIVRRIAPNAPSLFDENGNLNWENGTWNNPLAEFESKFKSNISDLNISSLLSYNINTEWQFKIAMGYNQLSSKESRAQLSTRLNPSLGLGSEVSSINLHQNNRNSWIIEPQLTWNKEWKNHKISSIIGSTLQNQNTDRLTLFAFGFPSNNLIYNLAAAQNRNITENESIEYKYAAIFGRFNYNIENKYIFNISGRRDGSSRFGPGKQFAWFGAVGSAWIFSNEKMFTNVNFISFGKLRSSYGITGNDQIGDYQYLDTYNSTGILYQGIVGLQPTRLYNPVFGWESNRKFETAIDLGLFDDKWNFTIAYYLNRSSSQLVGIPQPATTGFTSIVGNLGATVQNSGLEYTVKTDFKLSKLLTWNSNFTFSINKNKLISYPDLESSSFANTYIIGQPITIQRLYKYIGINPETGIYDFQDFNNDGNITASADREAWVDLNPKFFGGWSNQWTYGNWQLETMIHFVKQKAIGYFPGMPGTFVNQLSSVSQENPIPAYSSGANSALALAYNRFSMSDGAIEDASFIRLKNIALFYKIPTQSKSFSSQLFFQGQNLLTITKYSLGDPEFKFGNFLPPLKIYSLGFNVQF